MTIGVEMPRSATSSTICFSATPRSGFARRADEEVAVLRDVEEALAPVRDAVEAGRVREALALRPRAPGPRRRVRRRGRALATATILSQPRRCVETSFGLQSLIFSPSSSSASPALRRSLPTVLLRLAGRALIGAFLLELLVVQQRSGGFLDAALQVLFLPFAFVAVHVQPPPDGICRFHASPPAGDACGRRCPSAGRGTRSGGASGPRGPGSAARSTNRARAGAASIRSSREARIQRGLAEAPEPHRRRRVGEDVRAGGRGLEEGALDVARVDAVGDADRDAGSVQRACRKLRLTTVSRVRREFGTIRWTSSLVRRTVARARISATSPRRLRSRSGRRPGTAARSG